MLAQGFFKRGPRSAPIYEDEKIAFCGSLENYNTITGGRELDDFSRQEALTYQSERQMSKSELQEHYAENQKNLGISNEEIRAGEETGKDLYLGWKKEAMNHSCPPGKRQYQKIALLGLVKGKKLCLSDYEAESLRQAQVQNAITNMNQGINQNINRNRIINCTSNTYGGYMSTTCY